jgi:hypothetical protein
MNKRFKLTTIALFVLAVGVAAHLALASVGYYYNFTVIGEDGLPVESGLSVTVELAGTSTAAALYTSDDFEGAGITIPITSDVTGVADSGVFQFYGPVNEYDITVEDSDGHEVKVSEFEPKDHRIVFPLKNYNMPPFTTTLLANIAKAMEIYDGGDPDVLIATEESFTTALKTDYDDAVTKEHAHSNSDLLDALDIKAGAGELADGVLAVSFGTDFADTVTPTITLTALEAAASLYVVAGHDHTGFSVADDTGSGTDKFSWMAVAPYDPSDD